MEFQLPNLAKQTSELKGKQKDIVDLSDQKVWLRCFISDITFMNEVQGYSLRLEPLVDQKMAQEQDFSKQIYNK